jgi:flagellar L-ring protein precursor FlgH
VTLSLSPAGRIAALLLTTALLSGCGGGPIFNRDPRVSDMQLDGTTMPEAARVSVPMPAPEAPRPKYRAEGASLWERGSGGFFADQRATRVGDILTINVEIADEAALQNATTRGRTGKGSVQVPELFGIDLPANDIVNISSGQTASGSGQINRRESVKLKIAALVVQELPNGNFVVAGRQEVKVNQELRELRVAGIIRPQDIQMNNTIPYDKIAEARITYGGKGELSRQQSRSYGEDVLDIILPY